jgi:hypothetical protein
MIQIKRRINTIKQTKVMIVVKDGLPRLWIDNKHVDNVTTISFAAIANNPPFLEYEAIE